MYIACGSKQFVYCCRLMQIVNIYTQNRLTLRFDEVDLETVMTLKFDMNHK